MRSVGVKRFSEYDLPTGRPWCCHAITRRWQRSGCQEDIPKQKLPTEIISRQLGNLAGSQKNKHSRERVQLTVYFAPIAPEGGIGSGTLFLIAGMDCR